MVFCVHPQVLKDSPEDPYVKRTRSISIGRRSLTVEPTSSTRTLSVLNPQWPHAVKVHFPFKISRYGRRMRNEVIGQAIAVSGELEAGIEKLDERFGFLREVIGVVHLNLTPEANRGENWGYVVRDMMPFPQREEPAFLVPGFALYGRDFFAPQTPLLLVDLIGDHDPVAWVLENVMLPIVRHWVACFLNFGYLLEPHGQNVILEISLHGTVSRIIHRDLSVGIDMRRRRDLGLSDHRLNAYNRMEDDKFHPASPMTGSWADIFSIASSAPVVSTIRVLHLTTSSARAGRSSPDYSPIITGIFPGRSGISVNNGTASTNPSTIIRVPRPNGGPELFLNLLFQENFVP